MKLLGLRIDDHDSNITYTNGTKVRYLATERLFGIKHHGYDNVWQWEDVLDRWDIKVEELDAICIITDDIEFDTSELYRELDMGFPCRTFALDHHYAHHLSLWPLGDIPEIGYVYDGFGNNDKSYSKFVNNKLVDSGDVNDISSIGVKMAEVGRVLGLSSDPHGLDLAGKVMGLAAYGLIDKKYYENLSNFSLNEMRGIWNYKSWHRKWDNDFDINWLRTVHEYTGDKLAEHVSSTDVIGFSGGVAQNCCFNGKIKRTGTKVVIPPHANDCGLSLGAVEFLRQRFHEVPFSNEGFPFWQDDEAPEQEADEETIEKGAKSLRDGRILAWYQGHGEIGPRALGNRSILMQPQNRRAKQYLNEKVKHREAFRPFGAAVLREDVSKYFDCDYDVPYMNMSVQVKDTRLTSITHIDNTCRIQTVDGDGHFARLLRRYKEMTGESVILNTSLNIGGSPIASRVWEAKELFSKKGIQDMAIGNNFYDK